MNRGNNRHRIFFADEEKMYFRYLLYKMKKLNGVHIYHYCLMDNHIHLIVRLEPDADLSRFLKQVFLAYIAYFKNRHEHVGHLVQGRFKSIIIDTSCYLVQCGKYIEENPVRAKIVDQPDDYAFSSYRYYAQGSYDPLITPDPCAIDLADDEKDRQAAYRQFFIDDRIVNSESLRRFRYLGSEDFIRKMEQSFGKRNVQGARGRPRKSARNGGDSVRSSPSGPD